MGAGRSIGDKYTTNPLFAFNPGTNQLQKAYPVQGDWGRGNHVILIVGSNGADGGLRVINPFENNDGGDTPMSVATLNKRGSLWRNCDASVMTW